MLKRFFDVIVSSILLLIASPVLLSTLLLVWREDRQWPLYSPPRVGRNGVIFHMHKLRSMKVGADQSGVDTTGLHDSRVTKTGRWIRRYKLDELPQLWNVLMGEMSVVGPRPQIEREARLYTEVERGLLSARPGITDFSSIVFGDLAQIVAPHADANIAYNQLVRPWKSRLGLFYVAHANMWLDMQLILLTALSIISREHALKGVVRLLRKYQAPQELIEVATRTQPLVPTAPPGSDKIVMTREV